MKYQVSCVHCPLPSFIAFFLPSYTEGAQSSHGGAMPHRAPCMLATGLLYILKPSLAVPNSVGEVSPAQFAHRLTTIARNEITMATPTFSICVHWNAHIDDPITCNRKSEIQDGDRQNGSTYISLCVWQQRNSNFWTHVLKSGNTTVLRTMHNPTRSEKKIQNGGQ